MPRTYAQTVNAVQVTAIVPTMDTVAGTVTLTTPYVVGQTTVDAEGHVHFGSVSGAANGQSVSYTFPAATSMVDANSQLALLIIEQEGLDFTAGDVLLWPQQ